MSYGYVPPPAPPPPAVPRETWFSRNWKWFLPTVIIVPILLLVLFAGAIASMVFGMMKSSEPYHHAVEVASHDPRVVRELGTPIETGWLVSGSFNVSGPSGEANLGIPLKGPLHNATVYVVAKKSEDVWTYQRLRVRVEGETVAINLLNVNPLAPNPSNPSDQPATSDDDEDK
jgi:hypothetical protein